MIHGTTHLYVGEEATAVGACSVLELKDKITSTHRGHGHCIAKGADVKQMMAELFGRIDGYCHGKGGSMHIADLDIGNLGANGIVGGGIPLATGAALTSKMKKEGYVVLCFFGDGASNEGSFHESLNLAAIWDLPVVFICENNQYGMSGAVNKMTRLENIAERGAAYGIPGEVMDGNDLFDVREKTAKAVERARSGKGPTLLEAKTYRWKGHSKSDAKKYRTREEEMDWRKNNDPMIRFQERVVSGGKLTKEQVDETQEQARLEIEEAVKYAENSPMPSLDSVTKDVYA
jgi:pyruvate dehydrogenase E1 component alpha subunit